MTTEEKDLERARLREVLLNVRDDCDDIIAHLTHGELDTRVLGTTAHQTLQWLNHKWFVHESPRELRDRHRNAQSKIVDIKKET